MPAFKVAPQVFDKLPDVVFGVVVAKGINNKMNNPLISRFLEEQILSARKMLDGSVLKEHPAIAPYREAFTSLGFNPNRFMCSVEALCKRVMKGSPLPGINPIVDLGNSISMKYILPIGAHDILKLNYDLEVRFSEEGDSFLPFGEAEAECPDIGELVYASGRTVKTRRWIWRQSEDGKIDGNSTDIVFPIDGFKGHNGESVIAAGEELGSILRELFGCHVVIGLADRGNPAVVFE